MHERAGQRRRAHRAGEREGCDAADLACAGEFDDCLGHRDVELHRRIGIDDREQRGAPRQFLTIRAKRNACHFDGIDGAFATQRVGLAVLIEQAMLRKIEIEVARLGWQIHSLKCTAAFLVDDVEALHDTKVVTHLFVVAWTATFLQVAAKRRPANRGEDDAVTTNF